MLIPWEGCMLIPEVYMKCIYGILFENGKWYVGRTNNFQRRKEEHLRSKNNPKASDYDSQKYRAMRKYLYDFIILEEVDDENLLPELEIKWIKILDSYVNGYNMSIGGESYNLRGGYHSQAKLTQRQVNQIVQLLKDNKIKQSEIALLFNINASTVSLINKGKIWYNSSENYPLRPTNYSNCGETNGRAILSDDEVLKIRMLYITHTVKEVAALYPQVSWHAIEHICSGDSYKHLPIYKKRLKKWINIQQPVSTIPKA